MPVCLLGVSFGFPSRARVPAHRRGNTLAINRSYNVVITGPRHFSTVAVLTI
jgi:hypothetical protein